MAESRWQVGVGQTSSLAWGMNLSYSTVYTYIYIYRYITFNICIHDLHILDFYIHIMCIFYTYSVMECRYNTDDTLNSVHNFTLVQFQFQSHALLFSPTFSSPKQNPRRPKSGRSSSRRHNNGGLEDNYPFRLGDIFRQYSYPGKRNEHFSYEQ